jgi:hypothetical protein
MRSRTEILYHGVDLLRVSGNKIEHLDNRYTNVFGFGYNDYDIKEPDPSKHIVQREQKYMADLLASTLHAVKRFDAWNQECRREKVGNKLKQIASETGERDTTVIYYAGHGEPTHLKLPGSDGELEPYPKDEFFEQVGGIPGRKLVFLMCCHADHADIPQQTLLVTPSKRETIAFSTLNTELIGDMVHIEHHSKNPLDDLVSRLLTSYHNYPQGPLQGSPDWGRAKVWEEPRDWEVYIKEKIRGGEILKGYQRASVRSTLVERGVPLQVDPKCFFKTTPF